MESAASGYLVPQECVKAKHLPQQSRDPSGRNSVLAFLIFLRTKEVKLNTAGLVSQLSLGNRFLTA